MAGLSGLQARYDEQLRGTPGVVVQAVPEKGNPRELYRTEATPGDPLVLSLDVGLETKAEEAAGRRRPGERPGRDPAQHRRDPRRRERARQRRPEPRDVRPGRARLDVQDRQQPGAAARRADARHRRAVHAARSRWTARSSRTTATTRPAHSATSRCRTARRELVQHRVHLAGRRSCPARTCSTPGSRWASGSTTTSASRRTSARPTRTPRAETGAAAQLIGQGTDPRLAHGDGDRDRRRCSRGRSWCRGWSRAVDVTHRRARRR